MQNSIIRDYKIGDLIFRYIGPEFSETEYLKIFRRNDSSVEKADFIYEMVRKESLEIPQEEVIHKDKYIDIYKYDGGKTRVIFDDKRENALIKDISEDGFHHKIEYSEEHMCYWNSNMMMKVFDIPNKVILCNGVFLHASYVVYQGRAIIFTAPKQVGKSTQASLWEKYRGAEIVNGDRVLLRKIEGQWRAYGSPYAGTSRIFKDISAPVDAIIILSQGMENIALKSTTLESIKALMEGCSFESWSRESILLVTDMVNDLLEKIRFVKLKCLPDEGAVKILEEYLWNH